MFNAQLDNCSWEKKARPEHLLFANVKDQNASGPTKAKRPSTVKSLPNGCANKPATVLISAIKMFQFMTVSLLESKPRGFCN